MRNLKEKNFIYWVLSTQLVDPAGTTQLRDTVMCFIILYVMPDDGLNVNWNMLHM
jgi:hypothetical protein